MSNPETIHELPVLARQEGGSLVPTTLPLRVAGDGIACHPMTSGAGAEQQEHNTYRVTRVESPLRGWGQHDGEYHYQIGPAIVGADVLERFALRAGLMRPMIMDF